MTLPIKPKATEQRLDEIRNAAAEDAKAPAAARPAAGSVQAKSGEGYYGLPVLKPPTWTWEVPLYFFFGGIAGIAACIAFAAQLFHADPALVRVSLWIALVGAAICPVFLIADLGRPSRFLNMLRVFKIQSPMSVGAWVLVAFSGCTFVALLSLELLSRGFAYRILTPMLWVGGVRCIDGAGARQLSGRAAWSHGNPGVVRKSKIAPRPFSDVRTRALGGNS